MLYQAISIVNLCLISKCFQLDGLQCHIPKDQVEYMQKLKDNCIPIVECEVVDPYKKSSVLAENQCIKVEFVCVGTVNEAQF